MRSFLLLSAFALLLGGEAYAQKKDPLALRHQRINDLFRTDLNADLIKEIQDQLVAVKGTPWEDSLHTYVFKLGRALAKTRGEEAAIASTKDLVDRIRDSGPEWHIKALFAWGELNYQMGRMREYFSADSLALSIAKGGNIPRRLLAEANYVMGLCHTDLDRDAEAEPYFLRAIKICREQPTISPILLAKAHSALGGVHRILGRPEDAERDFSLGSAALSGDTSIAALSMKATILGNTGILLQNTGDLPRSKLYYHQSLAVLNEVIGRNTDPKERDENIMNRSRIYLNLASAYFAMMDIERVREWLQLALKDRSSILGRDHPELLALNEAFGEMEAMSGDLDKAAELFKAQLMNVETNLGRKNDAYLKMARKLARVYGQKGDHARSDSLYALVIPVSGKNMSFVYDPELAAALAERADIRNGQGRYREAVADLILCRNIRLAAQGPEYSKIAETEASLSDNALLAGDAIAAVNYADLALSRLSDRIDVYKRPFTPVAFRNPHLLADVVYTKVNAERALRPGGTVLKEWSDLIDLAVVSLQRNMASIAGEGPRLQLMEKHKKFFELALDLAFAQYEASPGRAGIQRFLDLAEADRSILLKSRLNDLISIRYKDIPESVLRRERQLLSGLRKAPENKGTMDRLVSAENAYAEFLDSLERDQPKYFQLRYGTPNASLNQLRGRVIGARQDLIAYTVTSANVYMLVIRADTAALLRVPAHGLAEAIKDLDKAVADRRVADHLSRAHDLYEMVFAPAVPWLNNTNLIIIPDGPLHKLNFEILVDAPATIGDFKRHLLLQRYTIGYLLSATTALQFADLKEEHTAKALVLAPGFTGSMKENYLSRVTDKASIDQGFLQYVRQPFALASARRIGDLLSARTLFEEDASEKVFRSLAPGYDILHLGTHAEMNDRMPMFSRLVLGKDGEGIDPDSDGYLHAHEIYGLDLDAQLAVLTACETGSGNDVMGEGVRSIGYSFAYAGCPSLIMSLWNIDEKVSSEMIGRFYEHLADGMPRDQALRQAKLDHLANAEDELALPYYWAGLVLVGDAGAIQLEHDHTLITKAGAIAIPLLSILVLFIWTMRRKRLGKVRSTHLEHLRR